MTPGGPALPRPLVRALLPARAPDPEAERLLVLLVDLRSEVLAERATPSRLTRVRFEVYRQASLRPGDRWRVARVADLEELFAEVAVQAGDLQAAWVAWRSGWWIRRLLAADSPDAAAHADTIMESLRHALGRGA